MFAKSVDVVDPNGRSWTIRREASLDPPYVDEDYEHDVIDSSIMRALSVIILPCGVWTGFFILFPMTDPARAVAVVVALAALLLHPLRRLRPHLTWMLVAETREGQTPEWWTGLVYGTARADEAMDEVLRAIQETGRPAPNGPFQPVN